MKIKLIIALIFLAGVLPATQDITVMSPNGGEKWLLGSTHNITWASQLTSGTYKITLWKGGVNLGTIATNLPAFQHAVPWKVGQLLNGQTAAAGPGYTVKIRQQGETPQDTSNAAFSITRLLLQPAAMKKVIAKAAIKPGALSRVIQVQNPVEKGNYAVGKALQIQWDKESVGADKVNIHLFTESGTAPEETIAAGHVNSGLAQWIPDTKFAWPGTRLYIRISSPDGGAAGKSGLFTVYVRPPQQKVVAITGRINNRETHSFNNYPQTECLSVQMPLPGRAPEANEIKAGHFYRGGKQGKCYWSMKYHFMADLTFDLSAVKGKPVKRAELLLTFSDEATQGPIGTLATNEFCNSESRIVRDGDFICDFAIFTPGEKKKIDLLASVAAWAADGGSNDYVITVKGKIETITNVDDICLKYYANPILFVEYVE